MCTTLNNTTYDHYGVRSLRGLYYDSHTFFVANLLQQL
jgi:hypothetical protein